jgi:Mg-chelatase subunit ChlD
MNDDGGTPPEPVSSVLRAASAFVSRLKTTDQVSVVTYATNATTKEVFTKDHTRIGDVVRALTIAKPDETGSTNTGDAIMRAKDEFASTRHNPDARKVLVLLTDGLANAPGETPEAYAQEAAVALKKTGTEIYVIGLGAKVNESFLRSLATKESYYYKAASASVVDTIYRAVTSALCEDGAAVIDIVPKTEAVFKPLQ